jgi:hypothetical protein
MVRRFFSSLVFATLALALAGCPATVPPGTDPSTVTGTTDPTFNQMAAPAVRSVTATRAVARTLLDAGKITLAKEQEVRQQADALVDGIRAARALQPSDAAAAQRQLDAVKAKADQVAASLPTPGAKP